MLQDGGAASTLGDAHVPGGVYYLGASRAARFCFGCATAQVPPDREANVYDMLPYDMQPAPDADIATAVWRYLIW